jgi:hypothetical protein
VPTRAPLVPADQAQLTLIGYWFGPLSPDWPDVRQSVDPDWDGDERRAAIEHLRHGRYFRSFLGLSHCRFCSCLNGSGELTDGTYYWPEGLAHYLEKHQVSLPRRFVDHVLLGRKVRPLVKARDIENAPVYEVWWKGQTWQKRGPAHQSYRSDFLEMLRQDFALGLFFRNSPGDLRDGIVAELGQPGEHLFQAVIEAQRIHEALYGPHVELPPEAALRSER